MTTLVTGGGSKVGSHLARLLKDAGREVIFGSRSGRVPAGFPSIQLDWDDPSTFTNPFTSSDLKKPITSVYLMAPITDLHAAPKIIPFVETAKQHGVKRFVYLSATIADRHNDSGGLGELPGYFEDNGFDYVALRPFWTQNQRVSPQEWNLEVDDGVECHLGDFIHSDERGTTMCNTSCHCSMLDYFFSKVRLQVVCDMLVRDTCTTETSDSLCTHQ
ncbi:hypothetical protein CC2G_010989 [Coprinopsis cinerea AmutBmut pab1-1]|nr:hypothetical protein CC2G_010989 [Coprinopsis cinerea AmutBmut pab1-1]